MVLNKVIRVLNVKQLMCFVIVVVCFASASSTSHKFYISKTIIEFNARSQQFEITCKLFTDDVDHALTQLHGGPLNLGTTEELEEANAWIENYMRQHFRCVIDGVPAEWRWVGKEVESDLTFVYLELYRKPDFVSLTLTNDVLVTEFPEQQNIVDLSLMGTTQTLVFYKDRIQQTFYR